MKKTSNEIIVNNIKYYRLKAKITQAQMAEKLGITEKHYCHLENLKYQLILSGNPEIFMLQLSVE